MFAVWSQYVVLINKNGKDERLWFFLKLERCIDTRKISASVKESTKWVRTASFQFMVYSPLIFHRTHLNLKARVVEDRILSNDVGNPNLAKLW